MGVEVNGGPGITDQELLHLAKLENLAERTMGPASATPRAMATLKQALPNCTNSLR